MTDGIGHGQHGQTERQGDAQQADPHIGEGGSQHGAPAAPSTSQKVPINSAAKGFTLVSPMMINTRARKAHTDTVIEQAPYYGSVAEQDETDPIHRGYVMTVTSY